MSAAVWSTSQNDIYDFPIGLLIPFFFNHGLLGMEGQYQWNTVKGGSDSYTKKIIENSNFDIHINEEVLEVGETENSVSLTTTKKSYDFDVVILASHADESLRIAKISDEKKKLLEQFTYTKNRAVLHTCWFWRILFFR
jgi:predicted NAD/FAD-binding protein